MIRWERLRAPREVVQCVVVGAGVVGMAIARQLASDGREVLLLEAASAVGSETSSRNSQVIHAGIYYPPQSLKATMCVAGNRALYSYCQQRQIPHQKTGKLIVATAEEQVPSLHALHRAGTHNGAAGLEFLTAAQAMQLEPQLHCVHALFSPSTGIIDVHSLISSLQADAEERGVTIALNTTVVGGRVSDTGSGLDIYVQPSQKLRVDDEESVEMVVAARCVINSAGLHATAVARRIQGLNPDTIPQMKLAKGNYFALAPGVRSPFSRLIYPLPQPGGLGLHLTIDLGGATRFGPDVQWLPRQLQPALTTQFDYSVDQKRVDSFYQQIRSYYPALPGGSLTADYSGIRPKLCGSSSDFVVQGEEAHGVAGLINLYGIESPGVTACLEIAKLVSRKVSVQI